MTGMKKKVTMIELARLANVNISTVSRALNDSPLVNAETKGQIVSLAQELGYVINVSARNLRRQSSDAIGIVIPMRRDSGQTISDPFFLEMVGAVSHAASRKGFDLILSVPDGDPRLTERKLLQTGRADGLIIIGQAGHADRINAFGELNQKIVVWGGKLNGLEYTIVGSDNTLGGQMAGDHLIDAGRRKILFIGDKALPEVKLRFEGFLKAHAKAGLTHDESLIVKQEFGGQETYAAVSQFVKSGKAFDAVFAASDVLAIAAMHAVRACGKSVPGDVAVVGYDNIGQSALTLPGLTTIDQNIKQGGEMMVDLLLSKLAGETVHSEVTPTRLVVRGSTTG
jgi:DNA-binding LacI/PurR family transcriptional regulator